MTFNIGSQQAGNINNVGRDQVVDGGQHATVVAIDGAREAATDLVLALARVQLPPVASAARDEAAAIQAEIRQQSPSRQNIAERLKRLTGLLVAAGSIGSAVSSIVTPIRAIAQWLGPLGDRVVPLLDVLV